MDINNLLLIALRLIHIMSAVAWFGMAMVMFAFLIPAERLAGESGLRFMKAIFTGTRLPRAFGPVAGTATLAGILLFIFGDVRVHFSDTAIIILGIGAAAGILAAGHGGTATGRYTAAYAEALTKNLVDNQSPTAEGSAAIEAAREKFVLHVRISFFLVLISLVFMASARYF